MSPAPRTPRAPRRRHPGAAALALLAVAIATRARSASALASPANAAADARHRVRRASSPRREWHPAAVAASAEWREDEVGLGTHETCDTCARCLLDPAPPSFRNPNAPRADPKTGLVHCEKCLGCNVILSRMNATTRMKGEDVKIFTGASGAAVMRGVTATRGDVFVKAWCGLVGGYRQTPLNDPIPEECHDAPGEMEKDAEMAKCKRKGGVFGYGECNFKFLNALDALAADANLSAATPRSWTDEIRSFLPTAPDDPSSWSKVATRAQLYEVVDGVSVEAFYAPGMTRKALEVTRSVPREDVLRCATFDLLFSEQDRHGQNVFVSETGRLRVLDNEGAFGSVNSMFLPGGQKFEVYRIGYAAVCCGNYPGGAEKNCPGKIDPISAPEVLMDYRCHVPGGFVGTAFPPGVEPFLRRIDAMTEDEVFERYGMSHREHAGTLKRRVADAVDGGFERALMAAYARQEPGDGIRYGNDFSYGINPACCGVGLEHCAVRAPEETARLPREERVARAGEEYEPGPLATRLWRGPVRGALHVKNATHGRKLLRGGYAYV
ncbi:uncharacterized protein MICPUCDRAFT_56448 [Micromonas pusilla CCMP1545]|uniref:Predicted protein n=1 Tax=Micromonas pusilla (strain CCMP1545) TaxID=564608 RepID=C1MM97_MICPC|nr:uncharacterized protein MICPUCDRAFT_56448 [Micromonas pusilla CCMP1545]EEH58539.1 predicted protein [Micromonas pusilla CCMP1545]|eukprot:XP_003056894.1 predicted protein [Micromonas pusilla CCMP1545]